MQTRLTNRQTDKHMIMRPTNRCLFATYKTDVYNLQNRLHKKTDIQANKQTLTDRLTRQMYADRWDRQTRPTTQRGVQNDRQCLAHVIYIVTVIIIMVKL